MTERSPRILVVRTDRVGDAVLMTPLLRGLRQQFPRGYIATLVNPRTRNVLLHNPHIDEILVDDPASMPRGRSGFWQQVRMLRGKKFDTALLLLPTERHAWMLFAAGIWKRYSVGVKLYGVLTGMRTVSRHGYVPLRHEADYCMDFGRKLGATSTDLSTEVFLRDEELHAARSLLLERGLRPSRTPSITGDIIVGINPGSGSSAPNWNVDRYVGLAKLLTRHDNVKIVVTGSDSERELAKAFDSLPANVVNLVGGSLREMMALIAHVHVFVSSSTGPMHLAAALKIPTVSMFCPIPHASVAMWGPLGNRATIVTPPPDFCSLRCPGDPHICEFEGGIHPQEVADAVMEILDRHLNATGDH
jgi:ADP-heptose:LPS heptosyltransferase